LLLIFKIPRNPFQLGSTENRKNICFGGSLGQNVAAVGGAFFCEGFLRNILSFVFVRIYFGKIQDQSQSKDFSK